MPNVFELLNFTTYDFVWKLAEGKLALVPDALLR